MTVYQQIGRNKRNSVLLIFFFITLISAIGVTFGMLTGNTIGWFVIAFAISIISAWYGYYYSDQLVLRMSGAHEVSLKNNRQLYHLMENLTIATGLPMPKLYVINDSAPNAFATGRNPDHAVICVTTGLMDKLNKRELEGVLAHELAHVKNYDMLYMTMVVVFVGVIVFLSDWMLRSFLWSGDGRNRNNNSSGNAITMLIAIALSILAPIIATMVQLAVSRQREYLADATAANITRNPEGLASALEKIAMDQEPLEAANKGTAHLYIINPLHEHKSFFNELFRTHPPTEKRIAALRSI